MEDDQDQDPLQYVDEPAYQTSHSKVTPSTHFTQTIATPASGVETAKPMSTRRNRSGNTVAVEPAAQGGDVGVIEPVVTRTCRSGKIMWFSHATPATH